MIKNSVEFSPELHKGDSLLIDIKQQKSNGLFEASLVKLVIIAVSELELIRAVTELHNLCFPNACGVTLSQVTA
jgi:hypothetical protein